MIAVSAGSVRGGYGLWFAVYGLGFVNGYRLCRVSPELSLQLASPYQIEIHLVTCIDR